MTRIAAPYLKAGNPLVLAMVPPNVRRVLDVGCGAGDNAWRLRDANLEIEVVGLTHSEEEARLARPRMSSVHVVDLETGLDDATLEQFGAPFDLLVFSHVLEHLTDPVKVIRRCMTRLSPGGHVLIAVPNVLNWRTRFQFLRGDFQYADHGILDRTHMRFFTYVTAPAELIDPLSDLTMIERQGRGSVPLGPLRRLGPAKGLCAAIDRFGLKVRPNFCAGEVVMLAQKARMSDRDGL